MRPAIDLAPDVTPGRHAICRRVVRVELDRLVEQAQRLVDGLPGPKVQVRHCTKIVVVGIETSGSLVLGAFDLGVFQPGRDCADNGSDRTGTGLNTSN